MMDTLYLNLSVKYGRNSEERFSQVEESNKNPQATFSRLLRN